MATAEPAARPHDRHTRRRPFAAWMKRLASLKHSSSDSQSKRNPVPAAGSKGKKPSPSKNNSPYPQSGHLPRPPSPGSPNGHLSFSTPISNRNGSASSLEDGYDSAGMPAPGKRSVAPTVATNPETVNSEAGQSKTGTSATVGGNSTFSSPSQSVRSLTTTLTTIQSTAPSALLNQPPAAPSPTATQLTHFTHQYPISPPASAVPSHLQPHTHPTTYSTATANNILTDNASILTLASSSKHRRRHSLDTNASVRALAPSSLWGGSRESLPLSVLSGNVDAASPAQSTSQTASGAPRSFTAGLASAERASVYSNSATLAAERNSYYAKDREAGSVRSGLLGHGKSDSVSGSIAGPAPAGSPLASPRESVAPRSWRRSAEGEESGDEREG
ncbi:hypothetical protein M501DRAFT_606270 [Patellaria atrata CBS 101060]|uniref:Uncharacterized protein n=1 Tax=Patellaria atrata CBS 101060 TaxID=1346257 RepID=A0A9P4VP70_9PEZI|nr:hypothetical protein M501DRAFT_606270 [Patellaria atrata CBS 101060]